MISLVGMVPEENLGVVILSNKNPHNLINSLFFHLMDGFMNVPPQDWNKVFLERDHEISQKSTLKKAEAERNRVGKVLSTSLNAYSGRYESRIYGQASLEIENGSLTIRLAAHPEILGILEHWDADTFLCHWSDPIFDQSLIPFNLSENDTPIDFHLSIRPDWIDPLEYVFTRVE